jgi:hypothetical protein
MPADIMLTVTLDASLGAALRQAVKERAWSFESFALICIRQHRAVAVRDTMFIERMETVDSGVHDDE